MRFIISRTSQWDGEPHNKAYQDKFIRVDTRVVDCPSKLNHRVDRENWYEKGTNHRVENGCIKRDFIGKNWFIDISSLEELLEFKEEVGEDIVIQNSWENEELLEIEIYDTYRE